MSKCVENRAQKCYNNKKRKADCYMKKILAAVLALTFAASLCSCSFSKGIAGSESETAVEETTEEATKYSMNVEDYVYPEKKVSKLFIGSFQITGETDIYREKKPSRLPQLSMDTKDASEINDDIHAKYNKIFETLESSEDNVPVPRTDYKAYLNDNILSLVIETRSIDTPNSGFNVYNINVETGQKVDSDEIIKLSSVSREEADKLLKEEITKVFDKLANLGESMASAADEAKRKSLAGDNIAKAVYYFDDSRNLTVAYQYYWIAGANNYGAISTLEAAKTKG